MSALGRLALVIHRLPGRTFGLALAGSLLLPLAAGAGVHRPGPATEAPSAVDVAVHAAPHPLAGVGPGTAAGATPGATPRLAPRGTDVAGMLAALALLVAMANVAGMLLARKPHPRRTASGVVAHPEGP